MTAGDDESELIGSAREGAGPAALEAFGRLVQRYQDVVYRMVRTRVRDADLANDIAQEVFLQAWRAIKDFDPRARFSTWLFRIAINTSISHHRRAVAVKRGSGAAVLAVGSGEDEVDPSSAAGREPGQDAPELPLLRSELHADVRQAVNSLEPVFREVIILREFDDLSYEQIAEVLGINTGTVRSRLARARERLREKLRHLVED